MALKSLGEVAGRLLYALLFIYAARQLGAGQFGRYSFAASLSALALIGMDLGLNLLFIRDGAQKPREINRYAGTLLLVKSCLGGTMLLGIYLFCLAMAYPPSDTYLIMAVAFLQAMWGLAEFGIAGLNAMERMDKEALVRSGAKFAALILAGGLLLAGAGLWGLVGGVAMANFMAACLSLWFLGRAAGFSFKPAPGFLGYIFKEALPLALTSVFILVYFRVDMVMLELMGKGFKEIGWYGAGIRIIDAIGMVPALVMGAMLPVLSSLAPKDRPGLKKLFSQGQRLLWMLGLPAAVGLWVVRGQAAVLIYGQGYAPTARAFWWLAPVLVFLFMNHLQLGVLTALGRQRLCALATGVCVLVNVLLNLALIPGYGFVGAAAATLATEFVLFGQCAWFIRGELGGTGLIRHAIKPALATGFMAGVLVFSHDWPLAVMIPFAMAVYGGALLALGGITRSELGELAGLLRPTGRGGA